MESTLKAVLGGMRRLEKGADWSCQAALAAMSAVVLLQVLLRYVFAAPLVWAEEASVFLMIWVTFIGSGIAIRKKAHIAMTLVADRLPVSIARAVLATSNFAIVAFLAVVAWQGFRLAAFVSDQPSPAMRIPMTWPYLAIPVGALFMIGQVLATMIESDGGTADEVTRATPDANGGTG
jgi:TRAP-type C4-dicarboxylate transport system permease small subunit